MIYQKPKGQTLISMCMWIDEHAYDEPRDDDKMFQYLYHICRMRAVAMRFFKLDHYYDDFAIFAATEIFMRYLSPRQYQYDENGNPKVPKVKSVLNLVNSILRCKKVDFEQREYYKIPLVEEEDITYEKPDFRHLINSQIEPFVKIEFNLVMEGLDKIVDSFLSTLPYANESAEWMNICFSVKYSLLCQLNPSEKMRRQLQRHNKSLDLERPLVEKIYDNLSKQIILFHLDESYRDLVTLLVRQLKTYLSKELCGILSDTYMDLQMEDLILTDYQQEVQMQNEASND